MQNESDLSYIAPAIRHLAVPIDSLSSDSANINTHNERNLATIRGSLRRFRQQTPIVIDGNRVIRKGNGTYEAAKLEGWTHIAVVQSDLTGAEATSYAIADNRSGRLSEFDPDALAQQLQSLSPSETQLASMGFTPQELANMLSNGVPNDPDQTWQGMPECVSEDQTAFASIKINFASSEDRDAFAKLIGQTVTENTRSIWYPPAPIGRTADKRYVDAS